jgi:hypothetical protein
MRITMKFARRRSFCGAALSVWLAAMPLAATMGLALADGDQPPSPPNAAQQKTSPPPASKPGFWHEVGHELGHWWDISVGYFRDRIKETPGAFLDFGKKSGDAAKSTAVATQEGMKEGVQKTLDVSKDAATTIVRLPNTRVVDVHQRCVTAPNGAPDCGATAAIACRSKGFSGGRPLDSRTGEQCPDTVLQSGRQPAKGECPLETVVLRAVCQ